MMHQPLQGVGLGLRRPHLIEVAEAPCEGVPFWEIAPENVIGEGGRLHRAALEVLQRDPILSHGLSLSLGATTPGTRTTCKPCANSWALSVRPGIPSICASPRFRA